MVRLMSKVKLSLIIGCMAIGLADKATSVKPRPDAAAERTPGVKKGKGRAGKAVRRELAPTDPKTLLAPDLLDEAFRSALQQLRDFPFLYTESQKNFELQDQLLREAHAKGKVEIKEEKHSLACCYHARNLNYSYGRTPETGSLPAIRDWVEDTDEAGDAAWATAALASEAFDTEWSITPEHQHSLKADILQPTLRSYEAEEEYSFEQAILYDKWRRFHKGCEQRAIALNIRRKRMNLIHYIVRETAKACPPLISVAHGQKFEPDQLTNCKQWALRYHAQRLELEFVPWDFEESLFGDSFDEETTTLVKALFPLPPEEPNRDAGPVPFS